MQTLSSLNLSPILPEIFLAICALILLIIGAFQGSKSTGFISFAAIAALAFSLFLHRYEGVTNESILNGMFIQDGFTYAVKIVIIVGLIAAISLSIQYLYEHSIILFEYPILILLAGIGMMLMVSANDLLALYIGLELQSLSLYVLASIKRNSSKSAEAGIKYFILGALSSGFLLFGISLLYGFVGSTNFDVITSTLAEEISIGVMIGFVFILSGLAFKISAAPFHMWTPDVYEGAPTSVTAFFAMVPKIAAIAIVIRLLFVPFSTLSGQWYEIMWLLSFLSMAVGAFAALRQNNIKRIMAYSSIGNMGYALIGIVAGGETGVASVFMYLIIYMIMTAGVFGIILCMQRDNIELTNVDDLAGLSRTHPWLAYPMAILMFSMSGIPPMAGFFSKFMVFQAAIESNLYALAIFGILTSVVAAYYYLRIIKVMFFDEPVAKFDQDLDFSRKIVIILSTIFVLTFIFYPSALVNLTQIAVSGLF